MQYNFDQEHLIKDQVHVHLVNSRIHADIIPWLIFLRDCWKLGTVLLRVFHRNFLSDNRGYRKNKMKGREKSLWRVCYLLFIKRFKIASFRGALSQVLNKIKKVHAFVYILFLYKIYLFWNFWQVFWIPKVYCLFPVLRMFWRTP